MSARFKDKTRKKAQTAQLPVARTKQEPQSFNILFWGIIVIIIYAMSSCTSSRYSESIKGCKGNSKYLWGTFNGKFRK